LEVSRQQGGAIIEARGYDIVSLTGRFCHEDVGNGHHIELPAEVAGERGCRAAHH
jgi:hypothetical protein